jgi:hypothetical protein
VGDPVGPGDRSVTGLLSKLLSGQIRPAGTRVAQHRTRSTDRTKDTSVTLLPGSHRVGAAPARSSRLCRCPALTVQAEFATAPNSPAVVAAIAPSIPTVGGRQPRSRLERRAAPDAGRPGRLRTGCRVSGRADQGTASSHPGPRRRLPRPVVRSEHPQRERKRVARLLIEDVTLAKTDKIHLHVRFRGGQTTSLAIPIPLTGWKARQTEPDVRPSRPAPRQPTDTEVADTVNAAGHRSGMRKAFTR